MAIAFSIPVHTLAAIGLPGSLAPSAQDQSTRFRFRPDRMSVNSCQGQEIDALGNPRLYEQFLVVLEGPRQLIRGGEGISRGARLFTIMRTCAGSLAYDIQAPSLDAGTWLLELLAHELEQRSEAVVAA